MKTLFHFSMFLLLVGNLTGCKGQSNNNQTSSSSYDSNKLVGGPCDGCELMFVGMPTDIKNVDTSAGWHEAGQKLLITGTIYKLDGKTPAPDVVVYYWQTDNNGYYSPKDGMEEEATRHGHIRGWIKTGADGKYSIYTIRPAPYPDNTMPAHIHTSIKEPDIANEYYIDEFIFIGDTLIAPSFIKYPPEKRGGSGIMQVSTSGKLQIANHDIILGLNVPNYPEKR